MANAGQTISTSWCLSAHPTPLPPWKHPINFLTNLTFGKLLFRLNKNSKVKVIQGPDGVVIRAMDAVCYIIYDRFHVAVHLFSNRSWMTSKCGKNSLCATFSCNLTTFWRLLWSVTEKTHMKSICFIQKRSEKVNSDFIYASVLQWIIGSNQFKWAQSWAYFIISPR